MIVGDGDVDVDRALESVRKLESKPIKWMSAHTQVAPLDAGTLRNPPIHIGNICKDFRIFEVASLEVEMEQEDDLIGDKLLKTRTFSPYSKTQSPAPDSTRKHIGDYCKDYSIFQVVAGH